MRDIVIVYERPCKVTTSAEYSSLTPLNRTTWQDKPYFVTLWLVASMTLTSMVLPSCWKRITYSQINPNSIHNVLDTPRPDAIYTFPLLVQASFTLTCKASG